MILDLSYVWGGTRRNNSCDHNRRDEQNIENRVRLVLQWVKDFATSSRRGTTVHVAQEYYVGQRRALLVRACHHFPSIKLTPAGRSDDMVDVVNMVNPGVRNLKQVL